ncbi:MAG: tRNA adenosine(34) deaminase TadA [candidate division Zixibacteria bacterium]|nr:tRNA adenosine(34) deaminase TadA [candidate division Zixibacteria bacterium]
MEPEMMHYFMGVALREAAEAFDKGEVPVGSVVVFENRIVGRGHNLTASMRDASAHAEMVALSAAYSHFNDWRLENCWLFSTLEPCPMCAGAAMLSRIHTLVYGARDPKFGACGSIIDIPAEPRFNHRIAVIEGVRADEVSELMKQFFQEIRRKNERIH